MPEEEIERRIDWHQTKGLSLSIIMLLIVNIVSTVWWAATLTNDVNQGKDNDNRVSLIVPKLTERIIRLEAVTSEYQRILTRVVATLDKMDNTVNRIDREQAKRGPIVYKRNKRQ